MAVQDSPTMGMQHVTVVPTNFHESEGDEEAEADSADREPRVPRHR